MSPNPTRPTSSLRSRIFKSSRSTSSQTHIQDQNPPPYEESLPPMSSTREPKPVGGQMTEGVGVSRKKPKPSKMQKFKEYVREDAERQANGNIWGGRTGMRGYG